MSGAKDVIVDFLYGKAQDLGTLSCADSAESANDDAEAILSALAAAGYKVLSREPTDKQQSAAGFYFIQGAGAVTSSEMHIAARALRAAWDVAEPDVRDPLPAPTPGRKP